MAIPKTAPEVICATSYDDTTQFLKRVLKSYKDKRPEILFFDLGEQSITYEEFVTKNSIDKSAIVVFGGHGSSDALFVKGKGDRLSVFYDRSYFVYGPSVLAAFACLAGAGLGSKFAEETGGAFFGYECEISFIDKPGYSQWWEEIFHSIMNRVFEEKKVTDGAVAEIKQLYETIIESFESGAESFREYAPIMKMFLREQLDGICGY